ncbi:MAG: fused MFS/spermidine synthase, partial [Steroidobacteraceae bacterium]
MAVELLGGRLLAPTFGSSIYVWGAIITIFMLALSLGYLAGGRYSMLAPSVRRLGVILTIAALSVVPLLLFAIAARRMDYSTLG